jgi:hypothetical protein
MFAAHHLELRRFAAKFCPTVEKSRNKILGSLMREVPDWDKTEDHALRGIANWQRLIHSRWGLVKGVCKK